MGSALLIIGALGTTALAWLVWRVTVFLRWKGIVDKLGGPPALPLIGNVHQLPTDSTEILPRLFQFAKQYSDKKCFRLWIGPTTPFVIIYGADQVESLMTSNKLITKGVQYNLFKVWLGDGLLLSTGDKWKRRRKMLTPAFHFKILEEFTEIFNEQARVLISKLDNLCDKGPFDICPHVTLCALDIICETAMGCSVNAQESSESEYHSAIDRIGPIMRRRNLNPIKQVDLLYPLFDDYKQLQKCLKTLHGFTRKVITERKSQYDAFVKENGGKTSDQLIEGKDSEVFGMKKRLAFMDMLLCSTEDGQPMSIESIQEETDTFMFEGHDTTSSAMVFVLRCIGTHPDVQQKLHEETDGIFGDSDRDVVSSDFSKMKYLECVMKESMRLYTTVPYMARLMTEDAQLGSLFIPKGVTVTCMLGALHRDPDTFPNPEKFDPDRFLPENSSKRSPFSYIPFSAGPRNCIGQNFALREEKTILTYLLRNYSIVATDKDIQPMADMVLLSKGGMNVTLTKRK